MEQLTAYTDYEQFRLDLNQELTNATNSFVRIGYLLRLAKDTQILEGKYKDVWSFAKEEFNLDKSQASRFMNINERFSEGGYSDHLLPQYSGYGSSKLAMMLTLPGAVVDELSPDMSKTEIKEVVADYKAEMKETPLEHMMEPVEDRIRKMTPIQKCLYEIGHNNPEIWKACSEALNHTDLAAVINATMEAMAPDGEKVYRVKIPGEGRKMVKVTENWVTSTDMRNGDKNTCSMEDVANAWAFLGADPTENYMDTWENLYGEDFPGREKPVETPQEQPQEPEEEKSPESDSEEEKPEVAPVQQEDTDEPEDGSGEGDSDISGEPEDAEEDGAAVPDGGEPLGTDDCAGDDEEETEGAEGDEEEVSEEDEPELIPDPEPEPEKETENPEPCTVEHAEPISEPEETPKKTEEKPLKKYMDPPEIEEVPEEKELQIKIDNLKVAVNECRWFTAEHMAQGILEDIRRKKEE